MLKYKLINKIVALSQSNVWDEAKLEWVLKDVYEAEEPETCLCGHFPIIEICVIQNNFNGNNTIVGNWCVKKFIGLPSDKIFQAVKRVRKNTEKSLNAEAIQHAFDRQWITEWEKKFYLDIMRKRSLSLKQVEKKTQINRKFMMMMRRKMK